MQSIHEETSISKLFLVETLNRNLNMATTAAETNILEAQPRDTRDEK